MLEIFDLISSISEFTTHLPSEYSERHFPQLGWPRLSERIAWYQNLIAVIQKALAWTCPMTPLSKISSMSTLGNFSVGNAWWPYGLKKSLWIEYPSLSRAVANQVMNDLIWRCKAVLDFLYSDVNLSPFAPCHHSFFQNRATDIINQRL